MTNFDRRAFMAMTAAPVAMMATPSEGVGMMPTPTGMPFLAPIKGHPEYLALCYPLSKIVHAYCYMLDDFTTIFGEAGRWSDGSGDGWRKIEPGQFDGRVIGRIVSIHIKDAGGWHQGGSAFVSG